VTCFAAATLFVARPSGFRDNFRFADTGVDQFGAKTGGFNFAKTRVTRPCKTRSEKHPNLLFPCRNGNSITLPLILDESRATRKLSRTDSGRLLRI
jgi:hypothetical protein